MKDMNYDNYNLDAMGHATSIDLLHWKECDSILPPCDKSFDIHQKWTGSTIKFKDKFYLFYTMRCGAFQRIGVAISDDLYSWKEYENNPVLIPDKKWFITYDGEKSNDARWPNQVDCRDMLVVKAPQGGFYGYFAAAADTGRTTPVGVIGIAYSEDLLHWEQKGIVYSPQYIATVEMMDVFELNGKWYMTLLSGNFYGSRTAYSDPYVSKVTLYAVADNPEGPFVENMTDNVFIGGSDKSGMCCRNIDYKGKKRVTYIDNNNANQTMCIPKVITVTEDGKLRPFFDEEIVQQIRTETFADKDKPAHVFLLPQNSFAWPTMGGDWEMKEGICKGSAEKYSWQSALFDCKSKNLDISAKVNADSKEFGFVFYSESDPYYSNRFAVIFNTEDHTVAISDPCTSKYSMGNIRKYPASKNSEMHIRALLIDGTCEVYINNELLLQQSVENRGFNHPGVLVDSGDVSFKEIEIYKLED